MKKSFCFVFIVLQGALSASLPASNNPNQNVDSFLKNMQAEIQNRLPIDRHAGAGVQLEDDKMNMPDDEMEVQDDETDVRDVAAKVQNVPPSIKSYVYYTMFSAYLSGSRCYHTGANFQFNVATVNPYKRYNVHTGIYTAPYTGYYVFTWTVAANYKTWFSADLMANGARKGSVMADSDVSGPSGIHPATGFVITHITANQHVYIRYVSGRGCSVKSDSRTRTTFSGWRIY